MHTQNPPNPFIPVDLNWLPWKTHPMIEAQFRDGTVAMGHFSPTLDNPVFWEYRGIRQFNLVRRRNYLKRADLPVAWRPLPENACSEAMKWKYPSSIPESEEIVIPLNLNG